MAKQTAKQSKPTKKNTNVSVKQPSRHFDDPRPTDGRGLIVTEYHKPHGNQKPQPLPLPTGSAPFRMDLADILGVGAVNNIRAAGSMTFHCVGDTGGVKRPEAQRLVASKMDSDLDSSISAEKRPAFFYHLGDVVYFYGAAKEYYSQFYDPYSDYAAPIIAIPGNHDGDVDPNDPDPSLAAYMTNFCAPSPYVTKDAGEATRDAMTQPNPYFTLTTPFATFIGLYTNVPEGGYVDAAQEDWLVSELKAADRRKALIVALHHPVYSADAFHGGSASMRDLLDRAVKASQKAPPHLVLTGHVHNYQRFTRKIGKQKIPYVVAGAGGYWHLHAMAKQAENATLPLDTPETGVSLDSFCSDRHGYLKFTVDSRSLRGEYFTVPRPQESWKAAAQLFDSFAINL